MPRIPLPERDDVPPESQRLWDEQIAAHGRMTNMKRTLARSPAALDALMRWYDLLAAVEPFLGRRAAMIFSHAISSGTDCLICSTFFRRILIDAGEDPDDLRLDERERLLADYGRTLARDPHAVSDELFARLRAEFDDERIVALTAFGAMMVATNLINNALRVELDEYLFPYRREPGVQGSS